MSAVDDIERPIAGLQRARATSTRSAPFSSDRGHSLKRRLIFALLVLIGLIGSVVAQAHLAPYATSGVGAAQVSVPPGLVILSLAVSLAVALLLSWRGIRPRGLAVRRPSHARASVASPTSALPPSLFRLLRSAGLIRQRFAVLRSLRWLPHLRSSRDRLCAIGVALALVASLMADLGAQSAASRPAAQWWWIGSVIFLIGAAGAWSLPRRPARHALRQGTPGRTQRAKKPASKRLPPASKSRWDAIGDWVLVTLLVVGGLALRLPGLTDQPYVVHGDEAECGLEALRWLNGGVPSLISVGWYGLPVAGYGWPALVMRVVGADLYGLRLSSVIIGVLSIALLYALAREYAGRRVAFVAAGLMAVAHIHIQFSRMGIHYIHALFIVLLVLWLLARALRTKSALAAVLAGVVLSLAVQVYFSARIIFLIVPLFLVALALLNWRALKGRLLTLGWMALSLVVSFGPLGVFFLQNPAPLNARSSQVLILNLTPDMRAHLVSQFGTAALWPVLLRQLAAVPLLLGGLPDQSLQYGPHYPMFDALVAALTIIGFFYALLHLRRPLCLLLVIWVLCVVVFGGVLTIDQPWWPRLLVMVPALCLLGALAAEEMLRAVQRVWQGMEWAVVPAAPGRRWRALAVGGLLALLVVGYSARQSFQHYFTDYRQQIASTGWRTQYTDIGRYLAPLPAGTQVVLFSDDGIIWDYSTFQFLAPQARGQRVGDVASLQSFLASHAGPLEVIVTTSKANEFQQLLQTPGALPPGEFAAQPGPDGTVAFFTYRLAG